MLGDLVASVLERFGNDVQKKLRQQRGLGKMTAGDNPLGQLPACVGFEHADAGTGSSGTFFFMRQRQRNIS